MQRFFGVYRAFVLVEGGDPSGLDRMKVQVDSIGMPAFWAPYCQSATLSEKHGNTAIVAFEGGDVLYPIVLGFI